MDSGVTGIASTAERLSSQRVKARGLLSVAHSAGRSRLVNLEQEGAAKIRFPGTHLDPLEAVLINTAGGLTGGDRIVWQVDVGPKAAAVITTQACEKVYRAASGRSDVDVRLSVAVGGRLSWLPQETIMFDRADFSRRLSVDLDAGAEALVAEATVFGRSAMDEEVISGSFRDRWRVAVSGRTIHAEEFAIGPAVSRSLGARAVLRGSVAVATVLLVAEHAETWLDGVREIVGDEGGASAWRVGGAGKLLARLYAADGYGLRRRLMPLLALLNGKAGLPKAWSL